MIIALGLIGTLASFVLPLVAQIGRQQQQLLQRSELDLALTNVVAFLHAEQNPSRLLESEQAAEIARQYTERLAGQVEQITITADRSDVADNTMAVTVAVRGNATLPEKEARLTTWIRLTQEEAE